MADHIIEIGDENGKSFRIRLTKGFTDPGTWQSLDKGFITENSGKAKLADSTGTFGSHLRLLGGNCTYGIQLNDFTRSLGFLIGNIVNSQGTGWLAQPWALGIRYGRISWVVKSGSQLG